MLSRVASPSEVCFKITGPTGYLAVEIPKVYNIRGNDNSVKATLNTAGNITSVDVSKNLWTPVGESVGDATTLLELTATDGPAAPAPSGDFPAVGTVTVDQPGRNANAKACTATLVDRNWVLTAASCFGDKPAAGAPAVKSTATFGGRTVGIAELAPRTDRDLVMARLTLPVNDVTPVTVGATEPAAGESLKVAGYGRTATEWTPFKVHATTHTVGSVAATSVDTAPAAGQAPVCQGDAGAPLLRDKNGATEIAAVASRSWQGGCLGTPATETRTGSSAARVDDLGAWVKELGLRTADVKPGTHVQIVGVNSALWDTVTDKASGWLGTWSPIDSSALTAVDSVAIGDTVHVFVVGAGRVYTKDGKVGGNWTPWREVPGGAAGVLGITATARGNTVSLQIIGSDATVWDSTADYANGTGSWSGWVKLGDNTAKYLSSATTPDNTVRLYSVGTDGRVYTRDKLTNGQWTPWGEIPGGAVGVNGITAAARGYTVDLQIIGGIGDLFTTYGHYDQGRWDQQWQKVSDNRLKAISSSAEGNIVHLVAVNEDYKVYSRDADYNAGKWTPWTEIPGGAVGVKAITATTTG
ncbi:trypsin-like serine protease [Streptomyces sp. CBMA156]|uniref:trypsin-like serine protease n=1 Tax=Streptomyces sp. CBMA156 TaxID=1930280 RepID=UPI00166212EF|nr:trypsin-like serine protease [Streptomyces sp. CBMA156]MBD0674519.1 hypothetical protein [Streptomyces sp. CBMA156]